MQTPWYLIGPNISSINSIRNLLGPIAPLENQLPLLTAKGKRIRNQRNSISVSSLSRKTRKSSTPIQSKIKKRQPECSGGLHSLKFNTNIKLLFIHKYCYRQAKNHGQNRSKLISIWSIISIGVKQFMNTEENQKQNNDGYKTKSEFMFNAKQKPDINIQIQS